MISIDRSFSAGRFKSANRATSDLAIRDQQLVITAKDSYSIFRAEKRWLWDEELLR